MRERTWPVVAALSFLTAVPVARGRSSASDLRRGVVLFPVVGAVVGALVAAVAWGAAQVLPTFAAAILGIASGVAVTAALHLDGLGDVADGIGASLGGREPVEAMRDPRLGTFGIAAVALDLLLKSSLLAALVVGDSVGGRRRGRDLARRARCARVAAPVRRLRTGGWTGLMGPGARCRVRHRDRDLGPDRGDLDTRRRARGSSSSPSSSAWSRRRLEGRDRRHRRVRAGARRRPRRSSPGADLSRPRTRRARPSGRRCTEEGDAPIWPSIGIASIVASPTGASRTNESRLPASRLWFRVPDADRLLEEPDEQQDQQQESYERDADVHRVPPCPA